MEHINYYILKKDLTRAMKLSQIFYFVFAGNLGLYFTQAWSFIMNQISLGDLRFLSKNRYGVILYLHIILCLGEENVQHNRCKRTGYDTVL